MRKGFTLVELLTVIVIISILITVSSLAISKIIKKSKVNLSKLQEESIIDAARMLASDEILYVPSQNKCKYIMIDELYEYGYIDDEIIDPKKNEGYSNIYINICSSNDGSNNYEIKSLDEQGNVEAGTNPFFLAEPDLYNNELTPIVYVKLTYEDSSHTGTPKREVLNGTEVITSISDKEVYEWQVPYDDDVWYDYPNQMWANAVILDENVSKNPGDTVDVDIMDDGVSDAVGMFVWIPRYSYTIKCQNSDLTNCYGNYDYTTKLNASTNVGSSTPGAIDIKFVSTNVKDRGSANYYGNKSQNWYTMPAFTLMGKSDSMELNGLWVGKFEISAYDKGTGENISQNFSCMGNCNESSMIMTLPNLSALVFNSQFSLYNLSKGVGDNYHLNNSDTHMIKGSEWASAVYLSQSLYGKYGNKNYSNTYKNVYKNVSSTFITGSSNGPSTTTCKNGDSVSITKNGDTYNSCLTQLSYDYLIDGGNGKGALGTGASTTGTIYGIYDLSGGTLEFVMFNADNYPTQSQFSASDLINLSLKYIDKHDTVRNECNGELCLGYGYDTYYKNLSFTSTNSFLTRGGYNNISSNSIFAMGSSKGPGNNGAHRNSTRIAIFKDS